MSALINGKKIAALALGLALMSSVAGQASAFSCRTFGMDVDSCMKTCDFNQYDPYAPLPPAVMACF